MSGLAERQGVPRYEKTAEAKPLTIGPCSYEVAHRRIRDRRGRAAGYTCPCGDQAQEWSYRGGSASEQTGVRVHHTGGKVYNHTLTWSGDPADYDALCRPCHAERDGRKYKTGYRYAPTEEFKAKRAEYWQTYYARKKAGLVGKKVDESVFPD